MNCWVLDAGQGLSLSLALSIVASFIFNSFIEV